MGDQLLRFLEKLAPGTRPEPIDATTELLNELVRGPRPDREQTENGVRGRRQLSIFP
jgi:hypothetical protein